MLGVNGELTPLPISIAARKLKPLVKGLGLVSNRKRQLQKDNQQQTSLGQYAETRRGLPLSYPPVGQGSHGQIYNQ